MRSVDSGRGVLALALSLAVLVAATAWAGPGRAAAPQAPETPAAKTVTPAAKTATTATATTATATTAGEVSAYAGAIKERHATLGQAIVLLGRLTEATLYDPKIRDDNRFWGAIDRIEKLIEKVGPPANLKAELGSLKAPDLRALHQTFIDTVVVLRKTDTLAKESNYSSTPGVRKFWNEARLDFLSFSKRLAALKAQNGLAP